jgi:UDP-N-acetylmuramate--alanine ligase
MRPIDKIKQVYCLGIGGIGVSALARYFGTRGLPVAGYDRVPTPLTDALQEEGMDIHFTEDPELIPKSFRDPASTLVIYTPAVPGNHAELVWFREQGFEIVKRAEVLGAISRSRRTIGISGTHGKTSITTMTAHLLTQCGVPCDAFMGGISKNYRTNLLLHPDSTYLVAEADEYDRSFLHLNPFIAVVTATDADHLDIYGTHQAVKEAFEQFVARTNPGGNILIKQGVSLRLPSGVRAHSYALRGPADFCATSVTIREGAYVIDLSTPQGTISNIRIGVPGLLNVENAVAAMAVAVLTGCPEHGIRDAMETFQGVQRRFDVRFRSETRLYIDDYGHHPEELSFTIRSVRELYPGRHITGIFQPHLFTRTRDLHEEFARSLSMLDRAILLDIYPAREQPIPGVTSELILKDITSPERFLCFREGLIPLLRQCTPDILLTMGAGDIDQLVPVITQWCEQSIIPHKC